MHPPATCAAVGRGPARSMCLLLLLLYNRGAQARHACLSALVSVSLQEKSPAETLTLPAVYSDDSPQLSVTGEVVHVISAIRDNVHTGCEEYDRSFRRQPKPWVALIQRGNCTFERKLRLALDSYSAAAAIIYNDVNDTIDGISKTGYNITAVQMAAEDAIRLIATIREGRRASVTIRPPEPAAGVRLDAITIGVTAAAVTAAVLLNSVALLGILGKKDKLKPHQYLVVNLIATDLLVGLLSALQVALRYVGERDPCDRTAAVQTSTCAAAVLSRLWNVLMYSNMFTLLLITTEHFFACRWPFLHKVVLTRGKVSACVLVCWVVSATPDAIIFSMECDALSQSDDTFCRYMLHNSSGNESWEISAFIVSIVTVVLATLVAVYTYILCLVHKVNIGNVEAKKKRNAAITSLLLVVSFMLSYSFFYSMHFSVAYEQSADATFVETQRVFWGDLFPTAPLLGDYVLTGVIGAILDPIIYCARTKELKVTLMSYVMKNIDERKRFSVSAGAGKEARSASTDYTAVTAAHTDEDSL